MVHGGPLMHGMLPRDLDHSALSALHIAMVQVRHAHKTWNTSPTSSNAFASNAFAIRSEWVILFGAAIAVLLNLSCGFFGVSLFPSLNRFTH